MKKPAYKIGDEVWIKGKIDKRIDNDVWGAVIKAFDNFDGSEWEQGLLIREKDLTPVTKESTQSDQISTQDKTVSTNEEPKPELPVRVAFDRDADYFDPYGRDLQLEYVVNKILDYLKAKEAGE